MVPIPKPGKDPANPANYRPISLTNVVCKLFERIVSIRLTSYLDTNNIIPSCQYGFRKNRSINEPLTKLTADITNNLNMGRYTTALFMDIERAFDKLWHEGVLYKMVNSNIPLHLAKLIMSFMTNREHFVRVNQTLSLPFTPLSGIPQGTLLGPLIFNFFTADIPIPTTNTITLSMYADDTAAWISGNHPPSSMKILQKYILKLQDWFQLWRMKPNPSKSQLITFIHCRKTQAKVLNYIPPLKIWNETITARKEAKYLGVTFDQTLSFQRHMKIISADVNRRINLLKRIKSLNHGCNAQTLLYTYKMYIRPVLEFAPTVSMVFPGPRHNQFNSIERRILRIALRLPAQYHVLLLLSRIKSPTIQDRLHSRRKSYLENRIQNQDPFITSAVQPKVLPRHPKHKYKSVSKTAEIISNDIVESGFEHLIPELKPDFSLYFTNDLFSI